MSYLLPDFDPINRRMPDKSYSESRPWVVTGRSQDSGERAAEIVSTPPPPSAAACVMAMESALKPVDFDFKEGVLVLAYHGTLMYEAEIRQVFRHPASPQTVMSYLVRYQGWKKSWDATVPRHSVYEHNDENLRHAHRLLQGAKLRQQALRPLDGTPDTRPSDEESLSDSGTRPEANGGPVDGAALFHLPSGLKRQLVDDWEAVTKENRLVDLPREVTVHEIIEKWVESREDPQEAALREVADGVHRYFNASLPNMLLYKFERPQYNAKFHGQGAVNGDVVPSQVYGPEHLLRLLLKLPFMLEGAQVEPEMLRRIAEKVNDLCAYIQQNGRVLFANVYDAASPEYMEAYARLSTPNGGEPA